MPTPPVVANRRIAEFSSALSMWPATAPVGAVESLEGRSLHPLSEPGSYEQPSSALESGTGR